MTLANKVKDEILVPEIEVRVSSSWINFINWCKVNVPNGQVCVKVNNGEPGELVSEYTKIRVRFDKKDMQSPFQPFS